MVQTKFIEQRGTDAVKKLRIDKLSHGKPFMINVRSLPSGQCYLEYPNGKIVLATYSSKSRDFITIRELPTEESTALREKFDLDFIPA
jgi:hypothetical protein